MWEVNSKYVLVLILSWRWRPTKAQQDARKLDKLYADSIPAYSDLADQSNFLWKLLHRKIVGS